MAKTRLQEKYLSEAVKGLMDKFNYKNVMEIPKIEKVVINMGVGEAVGNSKALESAVADLTAISGQKPVITKAKKSIAAFKLRQGMPNWRKSYSARRPHVLLPRQTDEHRTASCT